MNLKKSDLLLLVLGIKKEQNSYEELMGFDQKIEILNNKNEHTCVIYGNKKKRCWKCFSQCPIQMYGNSIVSDYGSVSIESLGLYWNGLNASVIIYCILWENYMF